ncbi:hypothetical protein IFR05_006374 [Cadophora sp. M221]|nr:hypothetical protein IFR05_006374 [Cadophora sp. M221]
MQLSIIALWAFVAVAVAVPSPARAKLCSAERAPICKAHCATAGLDYDCWGDACVCGNPL